MESPVSISKEDGVGPLVVDFHYGEPEKLMTGSLLTITNAWMDVEPVCLVKVMTGDLRGQLINVPLSKLVVP